MGRSSVALAILIGVLTGCVAERGQLVDSAFQCEPRSQPVVLDAVSSLTIEGTPVDLIADDGQPTYIVVADPSTIGAYSLEPVASAKEKQFVLPASGAVSFDRVGSAMSAVVPVARADRLVFHLDVSVDLEEWSSLFTSAASVSAIVDGQSDDGPCALVAIGSDSSASIVVLDGTAGGASVAAMVSERVAVVTSDDRWIAMGSGVRGIEAMESHDGLRWSPLNLPQLGAPVVNWIDTADGFAALAATAQGFRLHVLAADRSRWIRIDDLELHDESQIVGSWGNSVIARLGDRDPVVAIDVDTRTLSEPAFAASSAFDPTQPYHLLSDGGAVVAAQFRSDDLWTVVPMVGS